MQSLWHGACLCRQYAVPSLFGISPTSMDPPRGSQAMTHPTAVRQEAIERLHAAPWNPRQIKDERFKNLVRSIQADPDFLHHRPILATADGTIYAGNMRYRAAQHLGMATVPAIIEDIPEQLAKERALRDNAQWASGPSRISRNSSTS